MLYSPAQRFAAQIDAQGRVVELKTGLVIEELVRLLQSTGKRIVHGRVSRNRMRIYVGRNPGPPVGRLTVAEHLRTMFLAENPMTLGGTAATSGRWISIAEAVANAQHVQKDETDAARWVLDHIERDETPGAYVVRRDVLNAFTAAFPGPERVRGAELMQALRDVDLMLAGPSGRVVPDPALWIDGVKTRVLYGIRLVANEAAAPIVSISEKPSEFDSTKPFFAASA